MNLASPLKMFCLLLWIFDVSNAQLHAPTGAISGKAMPSLPSAPTVFGKDTTISLAVTPTSLE